MKKNVQEKTRKQNLKTSLLQQNPPHQRRVKPKKLPASKKSGTTTNKIKSNNRNKHQKFDNTLNLFAKKPTKQLKENSDECLICNSMETKI